MKLYFDIPFHQQYREELAIFGSEITLSGNKLGSCNSSRLVQAVKAIPVEVTSLNIGFNQLDLLTSSELALVLASIPIGVTSLNLEWNYLAKYSGADLALIFSNISAGVTRLDLNSNLLNDHSSAELALAFEAIPAHVTSIDLSNNQLYKKTEEEWILILSKLPTTVTEIKCEPECQLKINTILQKVRTQAFKILKEEVPLPEVLNYLVEDYVTSTSQSLRDKAILAHSRTMINSAQQYNSVLMNTVLSFAVNTYNFWTKKTTLLKPLNPFIDEQPEPVVGTSTLKTISLR